MFKKCFLLILFLPITFSLQAQLFSELHLKLYDNSPFTITIDMESYLTPSNNFMLRLLPGKHYLQVVRTTIPSLAGNNRISNATFSGIISIAYNVVIFAHIDPNNAFSVFKMLPYSNQIIQDRSITFLGQPLDVIPEWDEGTFNYEKEESYNRLKAILKKNNSSKSKLNIIKQSLTFNSIKSAQVAELMLFLDFDSERLELAKYAYYFTRDKENYYLI